jgi:MFS family permease
MASQFALLKTERLLPLFIVQFLGAYNDNLLKTIVSVMIAYGLWEIYGWQPGVLVSIAAAIFILPFILFTPLAGVMSDKYDKANMIKRIKAAEIGIAIAAAIALFIGNIYFALAVLAALGIQSAFFSPCKFAILPDHLRNEELIAGNGLVSTGTYLAILAGTIIGTLLAPLETGKYIAAALIVSMAIIGYIAALRVPPAPAKEPEAKLSINIFGKAISAVRLALQQKSGVLISILGVAYFYFIAATFHAQFPNFTKQTLNADNIVLTGFMVCFSLGIALGGLLNHVILRGKTHGALVPIACIAMAAFGIDIYFAAKAYPTTSGEALTSLSTFLSNPHGIRLFVDTFLQALAAGFFVIPMRAIVQDRSQSKVRARVVSSSNMMDAIFILLSAVTSGVLLGKGLAIEELYLTVSILTLIVGLFLFLVPSLRANHKIESHYKEA